MKRTSRRRGVSVLLVLGLLTMTLALSYAMIRTNYTVERTQGNYKRLGDSRQAAYAGLSAGLRKMQQNNWAGVGTNLVGNLGDGTSYSVSFDPGDASLDPSMPEFQELPYRVTVTATGMATDPENSAVQSKHKVMAVVRLIPRKLNDPPTTWPSTQNYTLYQWGSDDPLTLNVPVQIRGPVFAQGTVRIAPDYPVDNEPRPFAGQIDEVAIFGETLSLVQILGLSNGTVHLDGLLSGLFGGSNLNPVATWGLNETADKLLARDELGNYNGIYDGGKPGAAAAPTHGRTGSAEFDGFNDQIHLGTIDVSGTAMSISAWIKPTSFPTNYTRILAKAEGVSEYEQYWSLAAYTNGARRSIRFQLKTNIGGTATLHASDTNLVVGQWTHIAAVYDGFTMKVYQDGVLRNEMFKLGNVATNSQVLVSMGNTPAAHPRAKYLRDLARMKDASATDLRPLTGPITAPLSKTTSSERSLVTDELKVAWNDTPADNSVPLTHPGEIKSYQLYPGGKWYTIPALGSTLKDQQLGPDPENNPLGVFYRLGNLDIRENVTITGTVIVNASDSTPDIEIYGTNVRFQSVALPPLQGSSSGAQLPVAIVKDDLRVYDGAGGEISGLAIAWGELGFRSGSPSTTFAIKGRVLANEFYAEQRSGWNDSGINWSGELAQFYRQLNDADPDLYFPQWLKREKDLDPAPRLTVEPAATPTTYHWHDWTRPVFVAHPDDGGLRWEVLDLRDLRDLPK